MQDSAKQGGREAPRTLLDISCEALLRGFLEFRVWPVIPAEARRKWSRDEKDALVGYGEFGEPV